MMNIASYYIFFSYFTSLLLRTRLFDMRSSWGSFKLFFFFLATIFLLSTSHWHWLLMLWPRLKHRHRHALGMCVKKTPEHSGVSTRASWKYNVRQEWFHRNWFFKLLLFCLSSSLGFLLQVSSLSPTTIGEQQSRVRTLLVLCVVRARETLDFLYLIIIKDSQRLRIYSYVMLFLASAVSESESRTQRKAHSNTIQLYSSGRSSCVYSTIAFLSSAHTTCVWIVWEQCEYPTDHRGAAMFSLFGRVDFFTIWDFEFHTHATIIFFSSSFGWYHTLVRR